MILNHCHGQRKHGLLIALLISALLISAVLSGCATKTIPVAVELPCPDYLVLPLKSSVVDTQMKRMAGEYPELALYFVNRDVLNETRRMTLQKICRSSR